VNQRQRNSKGVGDILGEKQHKYFIIGRVVVLEYLFNKIRYSCSRLERDYFCAS
jgi:hypothetical protein